MGLRDSGSRRERYLQKLQAQANDEANKALELWRSGRAAEALLPNQRALDTIAQLRAEEPANDEHLAQLAGKLYNHAGMLAQQDRFAEAIAAARDALAAYLELTGGEVDPGALLTDRLLNLGHTLHPSTRPIDLPRFAAMTADAKCRLAALLAKSDAAGAASEAHQLAAQAIATYRQLAELDERFRADLARVALEALRIQWDLRR